MYDIGYIEKYGSGIYLENELCVKNGNPKPAYEIDPVQTKVIFKSQVKDVTVVEIGEEILQGLNERQRKAVEYIRQSKKITRKEYEELCKTSERTANRELAELIKKRIIKKVGNGTKFYYELAS
ncbi:MAG: DeoR family transcriptional regulator [Candidatus Omnitrophota bacterium]